MDLQTVNYTFLFTLNLAFTHLSPAYVDKWQKHHADQHTSTRQWHDEDFSTMYRQSDDADDDTLSSYPCSDLLALAQQFIYAANFSIP